MRYIFLSLALFLPVIAVAAGQVSPNIAQTYTGTVLDIGDVIHGPDGDGAMLQDPGSSMIVGLEDDVSSGQLYVSFIYNSPAPELLDRPLVKIEWLDLITVNHEETVRIDASSSFGEAFGPDAGITFDRIRLTLESGEAVAVDTLWVGDVATETVVAPEETEEITTDDSAASETDDSSSSTTSTTSISAVPLVSLVKLPNDGNPDTQFDTAVYAVDALGRRYPFSHSRIYFSWFQNFDAVSEISTAEMGALPLERPVPMHQGSWLIKIQSTNDVYAVSLGGQLWRIPDEETAITLYGSNWSQRVRDVFVTDWPHYTVAGDIENNQYPNDTLIRDGNFILWHIKDGRRTAIPGGDKSFHGIQDEHIINGAEIGADLSSYPIDGVYTRESDIGWLAL